MADIFLSRLFYASTATENCSPIELSKILASGQKNNPILHITGVLCFENNYFLQCLEGPRESINFIFNKVADDKRHSEVQLLELKEISYRYFEYYLTAANTKTIINKVMKESGMRVFNPYLLDSHCLSLLAEGFKNIIDPSPAAAKIENLHPKNNVFNILNMFKRK